jgi:hypothetical protein
MIFVFQYSVSDQAHYFLDDILFFEEADIETAYCKITDQVNDFIKEHGTKEEHAPYQYITINGKDISLDNFLDHEGNVTLELSTFDEYMEDVKKNSNLLDFSTIK